MSFTKDLKLNGEPLSVEGVTFASSTGISVLIVGAGVGGLLAALECKRQGHEVRVIEKTPSPSTAGDFFSIGSHVIRHIQINYPALGAELERINYSAWLAYHKMNGERISGPEEIKFAQLEYVHPDGTKRMIGLNRQSRPKFFGALLAQARGMGVQVHFGKRVTEYFETEKTGGVVLDDGERLEADVVIAADGVGTKSHKLVSGQDVRAYPSGFSVTRCAFPVEIAMQDPEIAERWPLLDGWRPVVEMWLGDGISMGIGRYNDTMSWLMTHKNITTTPSNAPAHESWSTTIPPSAVLEITSQIPAFPPIATKLISQTPKDAIVDWELKWRDPREVWTSPLARVIQLGDAAHTFLPSSGNGATQAIEDAISLAACLRLGGSEKEEDVSMAMRVHNRLRFQRVACFQLVGFINHQRQNNSSFAAAAEKSGKTVGFKSTIGKWAMHDPEAYAREKYEECVRCVRDGDDFVNTNIPPGYTYRPWSIQELFGRIERGEVLEFEGDWE